MEKTEGTKPIEYEFWITGPQGARFALYPVKDEHTEEDVLRAKRWLHNNQDVVSLQVRWIKSQDDQPQTEKIPDYIIIKNLKVEIGQKDSYILELEDKINNLQEEKTKENILTKQDRKEFKKELFFQQLVLQIKALEDKVSKCNKDNEQLIIRMHQPKQ